MTTTPRDHRNTRTRRLVTLAAAGIMVIGAGGAAVADPAPQAESAPAPAPAVDEHDHVAPGGIDGEALRQRLIDAEQKGPTAEQRRSPDALTVPEKESDGTQRVPRPQAKHGWELQLSGTLSTQALKPTAVAPSAEDDGAIPLARRLDLGRKTPRITTTGHIGDGPHGSEGSQTGDYDFYEVKASAGDVLTIDIAPEGELLPQTYLYDAEGNLVIGAQDMTGEGDVHLYHPVKKKGTYYIGIGTFTPDDPFDPASGPAVISEGDYSLDVSLRNRLQDDTDVFAVPLRKGDVLGATVEGSARRVAVHTLGGRLVQSSQADVGALYPASSPLPRGGNATSNHVVEKTGLYLVSVSDGAGRYSATVGVRRPDEPRQTVLLDFTGPSFDNTIFGASVVEPGVRDISPLRDFLPDWGLTTGDERAVIEATTKRVDEILRKDVPGSNVRVVSSLTHPGLWGEPGVSRVIVGGTIAEAGTIDAFGLSESVDPGNFDREETAIVLPEPMSSDTDPRSLNLRMTPASDRVKAVAQAIGNTAGHEIGHFIGNYHTDDYDEPTNVMNTGYTLHFFAVGPDGIAGTADDDRIGMRDSRYDPLQGLAGIESTPTRTRVALQ